MSKQDIQKARALFHHKDFGVLSTLSVKLDGFPFGSVVPYTVAGSGMPVIYISSIAQHTKNITSDGRASITILKDNDDIQAHGRLCIIGTMEVLSEDATADQERYFRQFPNARSYGETHDFSFYRLRPISIRYIGGFGAIYWFEPTDFLLENPFQGKTEEGIVQHMNEDHQKALKTYCEHHKNIPISSEDEVRMTSIDQFGFDVFVNQKKVRFDFDTPINDSAEARKALVDLAKG